MYYFKPPLTGRLGQAWYYTNKPALGTALDDKAKSTIIVTECACA
jgi:hypothetical protein